MKTFKEHFTEAVHQVDKWDELKQSNPMLGTAVKYLRELEALGGEAYIVGGAARDIIIGKSPKDIDVATNVPMNVIEKHFKASDIGQSKTFGLYAVKYGGYTFETANFREDVGSSDSRHPDSVNIIQSFEGDTARRDFTVNSMGINADGELTDYQGGLDDIKNKILKAVGEPKKRFKEDALRIIRTLRFAARLGFTIDPETGNAMKELNNTIQTLPSERITQELMDSAKDGKHLAAFITGLDTYGMLEKILPEVSALKGKTQNPAHHPEGDAYEHTIKALSSSVSHDPVTNLAILFHDLGKANTQQDGDNGYPTYHGHDKASADLVRSVGARMKLSNDQINAVAFAAENHMKMHRLDELGKKAVLDLVTNPYWNVLKDVARADNMNRPEPGIEKRIQDAEALLGTFKDEQERDKEVKAHQAKIKARINGNMLMQWGIPQGADMGKVLKQTTDWLVNTGIENVSDDEIKQKAMGIYNQLKSPVSLESVYESMQEYPYAIWTTGTVTLREYIYIHNGNGIYHMEYHKLIKDDKWNKNNNPNMMHHQAYARIVEPCGKRKVLETFNTQQDFIEWATLEMI